MDSTANDAMPDGQRIPKLSPPVTWFLIETEYLRWFGIFSTTSIRLVIVV